MTVKIVTDSCSDLSPEVAQELGITVVPAYLRFGEKVYRDGVDIGHDEFYKKLVESPVHPSTSQPSPADFADVYQKLSDETDGIVSIQVTSKLSGTYESALQGRVLADTKCPIEVVDTLSVSMGQGLIAMAAARLAKAGENLQRIIEEVRQIIPRMQVFILLDTLKYLHKGGRIGKAKALLGALLNVKPLLIMRDGELVPAGLARTRAKGVERLFNAMENTPDIEEVAIVHSTTPDEANSLKERIASIFDRTRIYLARVGPALGVHSGPGALGLLLRKKISSIGQAVSEGKQAGKRFSLPSLHLPKLGSSHH